jgi:hypothetical protein
MRLTAIVCTALLLIAGFNSLAEAIGLYVERLDDPNAVECPFCHKPIIVGGIHENAVRILTTEFGGLLTERGISYSEKKGEERYLHILVYRFQERQGGNFSVVRPASVGFHTHLYESKTLVSVFVFDETQQALSENILRFSTFLKRGARWITASELAREGVHKAVDALGKSLIEGESPTD